MFLVPHSGYREGEEDVTVDIAGMSSRMRALAFFESRTNDPFPSLNPAMLAAHRADHLYKAYRLCNFPMVVPELETLYEKAVQCS